MSKLKLLFSGNEISSNRANTIYALIRIIVGLLMAFGHGLGKLPPSAKFVDGVSNLGFMN